MTTREWFRQLRRSAFEGEGPGKVPEVTLFLRLELNDQVLFNAPLSGPIHLYTYKDYIDFIDGLPARAPRPRSWPMIHGITE